jgi:glycine/D-amino acid oxidase-like deaminating enzyme
MDAKFDQIIVGGGLGGLCCAAELVLRGKRPLLIAEGKDVGAIFAVRKLGSNSRFFMQHTMWGLGWGGGWWYQTARALNIPLVLYPGMSFAASVKGTGNSVPLPTCVSAKAFTDTLVEAFGLPIDRAESDRLEKVLQAGLSIPFAELQAMRQVPLAAWLEDQGADELVSTLLLTFCGFSHDLSLEGARELLSVFGGLAVLRLMLCGEGLLPIAYPNPREGLCIPMAKEIERRGGVVWRGRRVQRVVTESGKATGIVMEDGTEVHAPNVALACGNGRVGGLLDPLPPEAVGPVSYSAKITMKDFNMGFLLDRPIVEDDKVATAVFDPTTMSIYHWGWILTGIAPWTTEPGKQIIGAHMAYDQKQIAEAGGEDAIYAQMRARTAEQHSGFDDLVVAEVRVSTAPPDGNPWMSPISIGPKLPLKSKDIDALWYVGDGSEASQGIWSEAAASAGVLGARAILSAT